MINNESDLISNLSRNIKKIMADRKISMNELAKKTGLSFSVIRNIKKKSGGRRMRIVSGVFVRKTGSGRNILRRIRILFFLRTEKASWRRLPRGL